jgi:DNA-binding CsgD family transcriptional regulator/Tfp pilus assembly protein PilF
MLDWLVGAARMLTNGAPAIAVELLAPAVDAAAADDPRKHTLALELAQALHSTGQLAEAEQVTRAALAHTRDPDLIGDLYLVLGEVVWMAGRLDDALRELETALATIPLSTVHRARLQLRAGQCHYSKGDYDAAEQAANDGLAVAATTFDPRAIGFAHGLLGMAKTMQGHPGSALAHYEHGLAVTADAPALSGLRVAIGLNRAWAMADLGRYEEASDGLAEMRRLAEQIGNRPRLEHGRLIAAYLAFDSGQWDDVLAEADAVIDFVDFRQRSYGEGAAALVGLHRDDEPTARRHLEAGTPTSDLERAWMDNAFVLAGAVERERAGRPVDALAALAELPELSSTLWASALAIMTGVRLAVATADQDAAKEYAARLTDNVPNAAGAVLYCRGLLEADPEALEQAAAVFRDTRRPLYTAQALEAAADLHARGGDIPAARHLLSDALTLYTDLGATWDIKRATAHFRPYGIRHRQPSLHRPRSGPGSLSPVETTVAELVAQGLSNPEIADRLYLSRRTVQAHVSHILSKLGMQSRVEVAREYARVQDTMP